MSHLLILTAVKSLLCHLPHTASPHSTQPLLDLAPASGLHTWLQIRSHTDQVTPSLRPLHGSLLPSVSFKRAPRTIHGLAALSPTLDTHSHTCLCHFQNVLLPGRQNISHPPGEPNPLWCNELLQARLPVRKQLELGPSPKGKLSAPDTDSQALPGPLRAWGVPLNCPSCCSLCCQFSSPERKDPA